MGKCLLTDYGYEALPIKRSNLQIKTKMSKENKPSDKPQNGNDLIDDVSGSAFWNDDKVIDFVNWYIELHKLDFRYTIENRTIIESFKNGDNASKWHCH